MITALGGGVGAAKFLKGLTKIVRDKPINVIVNTGDDINIYGLRVSPDIDTIIYRLSDRIDKKKGWGLADDSFNFLNALSKLGCEAWFNIGDKDLATHIYKKELKNKGLTLSQITKQIAFKFGIKGVNILPMTDHDVETWIDTELGAMHFQEYYIKHKMRPNVKGVRIMGKEEATPAPDVISAINNAEIIIICPSNPIISIGPIVEINGMREALINAKGKKIAVSPLIGKKPLKGPADRLMRGLGMEVSSAQIAKLYEQFLDIMVIDKRDKLEAEEINKIGIKTLVMDTVMTDDTKSAELSKNILEAALGDTAKKRLGMRGL